MKQVYLLLLFISLLFSSRGQGREIVIVEGNANGNLMYGNQRVDKYKEVDYTLLTVTYRMNFIRDTLKREVLQDQMILQIGRNFMKFYSQRTFLDDQSYTDYETGKVSRDEGYGIDGEIYTDYDIIGDLSKQTLESIHRIPFEDEFTMSYQEHFPDLQWELGKERDTVCGYACLSAKTSYAGRLWQVWYTTGIPLNYGPWKLSGLPGLILKAVDSKKEYEFVCEGLRQTPEPIRVYKWKTKKSTKEKWQQFEKRAYQTPVRAFTNGGTKKFMIFDPRNKKLTEMNSDWSIPYNPLELE
ncbi:MAG: GLPGLI family protein [Oscillibacter sp.]|nr:GLPGLI family protein [Oscillibacter sp.]